MISSPARSWSWTTEPATQQPWHQMSKYMHYWLHFDSTMTSLVSVPMTPEWLYLDPPDLHDILLYSTSKPDLPNEAIRSAQKPLTHTDTADYLVSGRLTHNQQMTTGHLSGHQIGALFVSCWLLWLLIITGGVLKRRDGREIWWRLLFCILPSLYYVSVSGDTTRCWSPQVT